MIKNLENGEVYQNATHAALILSVTSKDICLHLGGTVRNIRGSKLKYIYAPKKSKKRKRPDLQKPVQCIENGRVYVSIKSAAKQLKVRPHVMSRHLKKVGRKSRIRGFTFKWFTPAPHHNDLFGPING